MVFGYKMHRKTSIDVIVHRGMSNPCVIFQLKGPKISDAACFIDKKCQIINTIYDKIIRCS